MDLVDKWDTEDKINDANRNIIQTYWGLFEEYIHPETNKLLVVVELLGNFHTKALHLVKQAGYEGAPREKVLNPVEHLL